MHDKKLLALYKDLNESQTGNIEAHCTKLDLLPATLGLYRRGHCHVKLTHHFTHVCRTSVWNHRTQPQLQSICCRQLLDASGCTCRPRSRSKCGQPRTAPALRSKS